MCCTTRTLDVANDYVDAYTLHVINHILKTRDYTLRNTASKDASADPEVEFRDQASLCHFVSFCFLTNYTLYL